MSVIEGELDIKKGINEEGFESETPDSGAAVLIGKKDEMPRLLKRLEKEGRTADLASYIHLHKQVTVPSEKLKEFLDKSVILDEKRGWHTLMISTSDPYLQQLEYIDKDGNVVRVEIDLRKIDEFKELVNGIERTLEDKSKLDAGRQVINAQTYALGVVDEKALEIGFIPAIKPTSIRGEWQWLTPNDEDLYEAVRQAKEHNRAIIESQMQQRKREEFDF